MSVINKMLRDLDQRQAGADAPLAARGATVSRDTVPVATMPVAASAASMHRPLAWGTGVVLLLAVVAGLGYVKFKSEDSKPLMAAAVATPAPLAVSAPTPAPVASIPVLAVSKPLTVPAKESIGKPANVTETAKSTRQAQAGKAASPKAAVMEPAGDAEFLRMDTALSKAPVAPKLNAGQTALAHSASDALAQAQSLWNAGSRAAAVELLQQALSKVESNSAVALPVTSQSPLAQLARELARMNLAEGQVRQALALLTRLEPQLSQIADLWAMRGNAAQRLGQHAQAVKSYQQALLLKPDEPRWMSAEAVSLAAQGQLVAASELAEKARTLGALSPEVAVYLRQLGVTVRVD